jgi:hypothetical protein
VGSKSVTSAAQCARQLLVSNAVTGAMPCARDEASRKQSGDVPNGETMPRPVMTIPVDTRAYVTIASMREQRLPRTSRLMLIVRPSSSAFASLLLHASRGPSRDLFDEIYARGRGIETSLKTCHGPLHRNNDVVALLSRPLISAGNAGGRTPIEDCACAIPSPEPRTVLIDQEQADARLAVARGAPGDRHRVGAAADREILPGQVPDELRRNFTITAVEADDRAGTGESRWCRTRKQIQQGLTRLGFVDRSVDRCCSPRCG